VKFFEFLDKEPAIGKLVIVEGTERVLAERAVEVLLDRLLPAEVRDLNLVRFGPDDLGDMARLREDVQAMPFLADRRVVVVSEAQTLRADPRRTLATVMHDVPDGNTLVVTDLLSPRSAKPQSLGSLAGRSALRIDTTADEAARARFVTDTLERLNAKAEPRVVSEIVRSQADLAAIRNDLEKLALTGKKITLAELEHEALAIPDPKAWKYARAVVEGKIKLALAIADELFETDRKAAMPLLSALARACDNLWELARPGGGTLPGTDKWHENYLRPLVRSVGTRRARVAYERTVHGIEAIVTGRAGSDPEEQRTLVDGITVGLGEFLHR
jgi:DNA polymerase III delta subunit